MKRFKFLAEVLESSSTSTFSFSRPSGDIAAELAKYSDDLPYDTDTPLQWWSHHVQSFPQLAPLALDVISAPASEAYVERIFSLSGELSAGKKNRSEVALEKRVFLKLNKRLWSLVQLQEDTRGEDAAMCSTSGLQE